MNYDPNKLSALRFNALRNIAYHDRRRRWFLKWGRITQAGSVFLSCGAIAAFFAKLGDFAPAIPSILAAAATSVNLVYDFRGRANEHHAIVKRYHVVMEKLESAINRGMLTDAVLCDLFDEMNEINKDEPPLNVTLNLMAHNEALYQVAGDNLDYVETHKERLNRYEKAFANWWDFRSAS